MTTRIVPLLAAAALLAASTTAFAAKVPPGAENTKKCGNVATSNGGKAKYIRASKVSCTTAKAVAKRAKGKSYSANGFGCTFVSGIYLCKKGTGSVAFQYKKPARK
ncbi:hypothetical protein [Baekduia sp. Peel2402]|uniref:hypothetical protein n=1 Tax=Baekduia sp. Peel2402 TaxID=3458296 RepID=UPI00403E649D